MLVMSLSVEFYSDIILKINFVHLFGNYENFSVKNVESKFRLITVIMFKILLKYRSKFD